MLRVKASRVDKLQVELNGQRERLEEASRMTSKIKVLYACALHLTRGLVGLWARLISLFF